MGNIFRVGCYDTFKGLCPNCNKTFEIQTKLTDCKLKTLTVGSRALGIVDKTFQMKHPCPSCMKFITVEIKDGHVKNFSISSTKVLREYAFGEIATP